MSIINGYKTYIGILVVIIPIVARLLGHPIGNTDGLEDQLIALIGGLIALWGRFTVKPEDTTAGKAAAKADVSS